MTSAAAVRAPLDEERRRWLAAAWARIDGEWLAELVAAMVDVPSPTGEEGPLAALLADRLDRAGADATFQPIDDYQANALGRLHGTGDGPDLLLYAPIDTVLAGAPGEDLPWAGHEQRPDLLAAARSEPPYVIGLGASNPKGHGACVLGALAAVAQAGVPLRGDVVAAFGAGGMPTNARPEGPGTRRNTGQGVGCSFLLEQGTWADFAVIAKPGWTVAHEEVGLCWFEITVGGTHTYVGSRHRLPYRNAIADAGLVAGRLEQWFTEWAERHDKGLVRPQGVVGAIEGGWSRMPSFTPAVCRMLVDLRIDPDTSPSAARRELRAALDAIVGAHPGLDVSMRMVLSIPGSRTDEASHVVRSAVRGFEEVTGAPHAVVTGTSGATDANILRNRGIPTARVGMPKVVDAPFPIDFEMGMNTVDVRAMVELTRLLTYVVIDTCTRTLDQVRP